MIFPSNVEWGEREMDRDRENKLRAPKSSQTMSKLNTITRGPFHVGSPIQKIKQEDMEDIKGTKFSLLEEKRFSGQVTFFPNYKTPQLQHEELGHLGATGPSTKVPHCFLEIGN